MATRWDEGRIRTWLALNQGKTEPLQLVEALEIVEELLPKSRTLSDEEEKKVAGLRRISRDARRSVENLEFEISRIEEIVAKLPELD